MRLLIDADACPVTNLAISIAARHGAPVTLVCDDAHVMQRDGAQTVMVSRGADSADFKLVNMIQRGDVVITQDYGLAAMCLSRGARVLNQDGREYDENNINGLLSIRHISRKVRMAGGRTKGPPKRLKEQDDQFKDALEMILCT